MINGWKEYHIEDFGAISTGTTPSTSKSEYYGGNYKFISPADLDNGKYVTTAHKFITDEGLRVSRTLPRNSILIGCIGNIGKMGMTSDEVSAFNQQINAIVCNDKFLPDFIYYLLIHNRPVLEKSAVKTTLPILNKGNFQKIKLQAPHLPEQRKIAYVLSTVQKAIEQQDKLIRHSTELKKALMQKLFTEGTKGEKQKQTEIGLVPESWEVVKIESLFDIQQGKQVSKSNRVGKNQKPFLRTANVFWGYMDFTELDEMNFSKDEETKFTLKKDDLLICEGGDVGRTSIWKYDRTGIYYQNHLHRLRRKTKAIIPQYFMYWMSLIVRETSYVKDAGNRTTIPNLSKSRLGGLYFPLPKIEYQEKVVSTLEGIDCKVEYHQKKKQTLSDLFKTLLHELMTGERRVHEIEFEALTKAYKIKEQPLSMAAEE